MKRNFLKLILVAFLSVVLGYHVSSSIARPFDVISAAGNIYLKVELDTTYKYARFTRCQKVPAACDHETLGNKEWYSLEELRERRSDKLTDIVKAGAYDLLIGAATYFSGGLVGLAIANGGFAGSISAPVWAFYAGAGAGVASTVTTIAFVEAINPLEQYEQFESLKDEIITDQKYKVADDEAVEEIIQTLDKVLSEN